MCEKDIPAVTLQLHITELWVVDHAGQISRQADQRHLGNGRSNFRTDIIWEREGH